jgi:hypothetical protein
MVVLQPEVSMWLVFYVASRLSDFNMPHVALHHGVTLDMGKALLPDETGCQVPWKRNPP